MSGIPRFNFPAFEAAAAELRRRGIEVISPVELDDPEQNEVSRSSVDGNPDTYKSHGMSREQFLARDASVIVENALTLDAIVTLPGWEASDGATFEVGVARLRKIPQVEFDALLYLQEHNPLFPAVTNGMAADLGLAVPGVDFPANADPNDLYDVDGKFITHEDNPLRQRAVTGGVKDNRGKMPLDLFPYPALLGAADVMAFGTIKYKPHNWRLGLSWTQTWSSMQRHLWAFLEGEDLDPESGKPHVDHAMCQMAFLSTYYHTKTGIDDRRTSTDPEESKA
jgi:hypothetical protein